METALRTGVLVSACVYGRKRALSAAWAAGWLCVVIPTRRSGPRVQGLPHLLCTCDRRLLESHHQWLVKPSKSQKCIAFLDRLNNLWNTFKIVLEGSQLCNTEAAETDSNRFLIC